MNTFVKLYFGHAKAKTPVVPKTAEPEWNQPFILVHKDSKEKVCACMVVRVCVLVCARRLLCACALFVCVCALCMRVRFLYACALFVCVRKRVQRAMCVYTIESK